MQQKVQFISTILHQPELVVLDEPFAGLDPVNTQVMKDAVLELRRDGVTILFSTHIMEQAEKLCDQLCLIPRTAPPFPAARDDTARLADRLPLLQPVGRAQTPHPAARPLASRLPHRLR